MDKDLYEAVKTLIPEERILADEPMSAHTTFKAGGNADLFISLKSPEELSGLLSLFNKTAEKYVVIGNGSNLLVSDKGFRGAVLQIMAGMSRITADGSIIRAEAGALLSKVSDTALEHGLKGLEFASGIPGTVGGAMVMNAGAYGGEMKDLVTEVLLMDEKGERFTLSNEDMHFGYRHSILKEKRYVALETVFRLEKGDKEEIRNKIAEFSKSRRDKQPLDKPSAGSTFKRPEGNFAGKLIMEAGLSGFSVGGAKVSEKHCGFIINDGNATAGDIYSLIGEVKKRVYENSGVELEPEVCMIGEF